MDVEILNFYSLAVQVIFRLPSAPDSDGIRDSSIYQVCDVLCCVLTWSQQQEDEEEEGGVVGVGS